MIRQQNELISVSSKQVFPWNWFKYLGIRSTSVYTKSGRKIPLRLNDIFGVKEFTRSFDVLAIPGERVKLRLSIAESEKLMAKGKTYRGKVAWPEDARPEKEAAKTKAAPVQSPVKIKAVVPKSPVKTATIKQQQQQKKPAGIVLPVRPAPVHVQQPKPPLVLRTQRHDVPTLEVVDDYDDISDLGLDFGSYSGTLVPGGVYVSVTPDEQSQTVLDRISSLVQFLEPNTDHHCTVLYSRNERHMTGEPDVVQSGYRAQITGAPSWTGHDGKLYLVLSLDSPQLEELNSMWTQLGYTQDFTPYSPHITVKTGADADQCARASVILNNFIKLHPQQCSLMFTQPKASPLRD